MLLRQAPRALRAITRRRRSNARDRRSLAHCTTSASMLLRQAPRALHAVRRLSNARAEPQFLHLAPSGDFWVGSAIYAAEHNPSDYPSRGLRLPGRRCRMKHVACCPACGTPPWNHPLNAPKWLRGRGLRCGGTFLTRLRTHRWRLDPAGRSGHWALDTRKAQQECSK